MLYSSRALCAWFFLALLGCGGSASGGSGNGNPAPSQGGAGGKYTSGVSGSAGSVTQPTLGGSSSWGGSPGVALTGGSGPSLGGFGGMGSLGISGAGASSVTGSHAGTSNSGGAGGAAGANSRGPAPTFTTIYNTIITPNCGGAQCHLKRPTPFGYDFSSKSAASTSWRGDVVAGDADNSPMFQVLNFAIMPKDKAPLTVDQLFMVYDWINAGALDN
ncbi:MAG TPA: hypothetical protein VER96_26525 [Polyangiaceae bacterium]|nr:hypothetical protein [Polyangiaceae bacterium]